MSKWRKLFEWITQQLTDSDTSSHRWQVDGPTHFRTLCEKIMPITVHLVRGSEKSYREEKSHTTEAQSVVISGLGILRYSRAVVIGGAGPRTHGGMAARISPAYHDCSGV